MLAGTLDPVGAASRDWGAVVVGAGPAGALSARCLAGLGVSTLLVERASLPRWKVCGCCLNQRALAVLDRVGLGSLPASCGAVPLSSVLLGAGGRFGKVPLPGGVSLSREAFDTALVRAAIEAGADFLPETRASLDDVADTSRKVWLLRGGGAVEVRARVVLAADGLGGALLARAGLIEAPPEPGARIGAGVTLSWAEPFYSPGTIYMACGRGGYVGLVRLEDGRLDLAAAFDVARVKEAGGPGELASSILAEVGWPLPPLLAEQPWKGTPPLTRQARELAAHRVFVLGDAAGYVEPFTGEGMACALASAEALAPLAARAIPDWDESLPLAWARRHRQIITQRLLACRAAAALLRRPRLTRGAVTLLGWAPALASPFIRFVNASFTDHS